MQSALLSRTVKGGGTEKGACPLGWGVRGCVFYWGVKEGVWNMHFHPLLKTGSKQHVDGSWYHVLLPQPAVGGEGGGGKVEERRKSKKGIEERERERGEEKGRGGEERGRDGERGRGGEGKERKGTEEGEMGRKKKREGRQKEEVEGGYKVIKID